MRKTAGEIKKYPVKASGFKTDATRRLDIPGLAWEVKIMGIDLFALD
ncbi:MAG TPA: hypothetical protein VEH09_02265 [Thermodesulfobacteriota bacterium]|nr:hypothetical protein [Thermodesulfobacteriota bacterium]